MFVVGNEIELLDKDRLRIRRPQPSKLVLSVKA